MTSAEQRGWSGPLTVAVVGALLVGSTWSDAVQEGRGGELITAACNGWSAHPPGAALFTLLGRGFCQLPGASAAGLMAAQSGLCALLCMLLLFGVVQRSTGNSWAGIMAALTLATGDVFWRAASHASPFTLTLALCLASLYCAIRLCEDNRTAARWAPWSTLAGLGAGLAAGAHLAGMAILPFVLLAALRPLLPLSRCAARLVLLALGMAGGLAVSSWSLPLPGLTDQPLEALGKLVFALPTQLGGVLWPFCLLGLGVLCFHAAGRPLGKFLSGHLRRDMAAMLALLPVLSGPLFVLIFALKEPSDPWRLARPHFILPVGLLCVQLGIGLALLDSSLLGGRKEEDGQAPRRSVLWHGLGFVVLGVYAVVSFPRARLDNDFLVEDFAKNSLAAAERGALVIISGVTQRASFLYCKEVLRLRPDVQTVDPAAKADAADPLRLVQRRLRRGLPVHLVALSQDRRIRNAFGTYPAGPLLRVQPPDRRPPSTDSLEELNSRLFRGFSRRGRIPHHPDNLRSTELLEPYARAWRQVAQQLFRQGKTRPAFRALVKAQRWAPWMKVPGWFGPRTMPAP